ncbi:PREDICTED: Williams-Beuren syndrome chromosomal region 16 protein [Odobenus rosmarus divergens]|uniref:RCC1-like G exchanging factor-like protein n=1 Tax=Odobenus rosmarus divergens TaxID=9708 RepID=A0A2U3X500_ODORO|nr:PREDICTED: Williams-Beuren syndrome chromosomal region 16 protein [Odobenus rosmarus divergens]
MALAALAAGARLGRRLSRPGPGLRPGRGHRTAAGRSRSSCEADAPVFQYVGERAARADRIFVWGFSFSGALGVPTFVLPSAGPKHRAGSRPPRRIQPVPYRLELDQKISSVACGYGFTLLSSKTKDVTKVWGMGLNKDSQLGFHRSRKDKTRGYEYVLEPSPVPLPLDRPQETQVLQVSCGRAHSLILTDREGVFSMGNNSYGQCGRNVVENEIYSESHKVNRMQDFDGQVVQVVCGQDHSLFLTDKGEVYSCGWGADGQTGLGHYHITSVPTKLAGDLAGVNIVQVATHGDCCLAVSAEGGLFGWGNSEYLQLAAVTDSTQVNVPRCLPFSGVGKVRQAACGGTGCAVLNGEGHVFVWGYGILGKGPNLVESALPEVIPPTLFGLTEFNPEVQVSLIRCGLSHFAALTNKGELFVWGKNIRGCLGIGRLEDQYFPWRVTMPGEPVDVACGVDHMVTLAKSFV